MKYIEPMLVCILYTSLVLLSVYVDVSIRTCSCEITGVELVPGCGEKTKAEDYLFAEDTVWVATAHSESVHAFYFNVSN